MKIIKRIKKDGWPVYTKSGRLMPKWKKSHIAANKASLKKFGSMVAKKVNKIKVPKNELLGSHTKLGQILISSRVPKKLRKAIAYHEFVEHRLMTKKSRR